MTDSRQIRSCIRGLESIYRKLHQCYKPRQNTATDEQLSPTKARCHFVQYVANMSDKFGTKPWLAAGGKSNYLLNGFPYLGKDEYQPADKLQVDYVVLHLMQPLGIRAEMLKQVIYTCQTRHRVEESWHKINQNYKSFQDRNSTFNKECSGKFIQLSDLQTWRSYTYSISRKSKKKKKSIV